MTDVAVARGGQSEALAANKRLISGAAARAAMNNTTLASAGRAERSLGARWRARSSTSMQYHRDAKSGELRQPGYEIRLLIDETDLFAAEKPM